MIKHKKYKLFLPVNVVFIICQKAFFCKSYSLENSNLLHLLQSILEKVAAVYALSYVCHICIFIGGQYV